MSRRRPWISLPRRSLRRSRIYALNASGLEDPQWLEVVASLKPEAVLVTYDNAMPVEHAEWLRSLAITLAVVDSRKRPSDLTPEQYWREVIHRHAHWFAAQEPESWWRYRRDTRRQLD
jgi:LmbE family N-acetylglucosaminyl deacetylase